MINDGHNAAWAEHYMIGCECGWVPAKRPQRSSMQHVPHQAHRRKLKLRPINYAWSDENYHTVGALSEGDYVVVQNAWWDEDNACWVSDKYKKAL